MGDLTDRTMDRGCGTLTVLSPGRNRSCLWINGSSELDIQKGTRDVNKAASLVCHLLAVNAWRRRREEVSSLQETIDELSQQVDHLHIQIVVLRRLLQTENCRVEKLGAEVHQVKTQLEDALRERDTLKTVNEKKKTFLTIGRGRNA